MSDIGLCERRFRSYHKLEQETDVLKQSILMEIRRMFSSKEFKIAVFMAGIIVFGQFCQNFYYMIHGINNVSIFEKWIGVREENFASVVFFWLFPILAVFPYGWTMCEELHNGYAAQVMIRNGKKNYFIGKMLASFISGGIVTAGVLMLDFVILTMMFPTCYPRTNDLFCGIWPGHFCSILFYEHPFLYVFLWTGVVFLWGGAIAVLGCALGFLVKNTVVLLPTVWLLCVGETILSEFMPLKQNGMNIETGWLKLLYADTPSLNPAWVIFGSIAVILMVAVTIFVMKGSHHEVL